MPSETNRSESIEFPTIDGVLLSGDIALPASTRGAAIVCHPHPQHGGNRQHPVVDALFSALPLTGVAALRFDFRREFTNGVGERLDAVAALVELRRRAPDVPIVAIGYSFGAMIALSLDADELSAKVLIAPPLPAGHQEGPGDVATFVLTPTHDQFGPPEVVQPIVDAWPSNDFVELASVDHFMVGKSAEAARQVTSWLARHLP